MNLLDNLNDMQKKAVTTTEGPVLVLAGAGSGKTTVLVSRLAYILSVRNVSPYRTLAITFTNKAANEMKARIKAKIGDIAEHMWIGTFHSVCVRILRSTIELLGYGRDFLIYDTNDTKLIVKECLNELNLSDKNFPVRDVMSAISRAKDDMLTPEVYTEINKNNYRNVIIGRIYGLYQQKLKKNNAVDFDDIIIKTIQVLSENPGVLEEYQNRFEYVMVDEYQDTNNAQYMLISLLCGKYKNICVVGDDDQSIYKFRGANIRNILDFELQYPEAVVIRLEQNYRSTKHILDAANAVIENNKGRKGKNLWTAYEGGDKITVHVATNEHDEGLYIAKQIAKHRESGGNYGDCAILYRINAESRVIEEMLMREQIPYRVLAGLRFYDRKEIKDVIAYLRVIYNSADDVSLKRIINEPKRGIGGTTVEKAQKIADENGVSLYQIMKDAEQYEEIKRARNNIKGFIEIMERLISLKDKVSLSELLSITISETGYSAMIESIAEADGTSKYENLKELVSVVKEYEAADEHASLGDFLENVALVSDVDNYDEEEDSVVLMTIHSAKGLEFPTVFLPGMENGLFPGMKSLSYEEEIEEERRLCYVAITRAKRKLYITRAESRMIFGKTGYQPPSIFLKEIPDDCIETTESPGAVMKQIFRSIGFQANVDYTSEWRKTEIKSPAGMKFNKGERVLHHKFGKGTVLSSEKFGDDYKLEILFDTCGKKLMMANFAKLQKTE